MVLNCKKITTAACRNTDSFQGFMFSLMLSLPFYINWDSQLTARWARAHFNGVLAKHAQLNGGYIIRHPDIRGSKDPGLYDPNNQGDLMEIGYFVNDERHSPKNPDNCSPVCCHFGTQEAADGNAQSHTSS